MAPKPKPLIDRFLSKFEIRENGCWIWNTSSTNGYGKIGSIEDGAIWAHRFAYEYAVGTIPEGMQLDHLCRNRACVNPDHLEPVTLIENLLRGDRSWLGRHLRERTHCPRGHPYDEANTWISKTGSRHCRACNRENMRRRRAAR